MCLWSMWSLRALGVLPGPRLHFECKLECLAMHGGQRGTAALIPRLLVLGTSRLLRFPDLQMHHLGRLGPRPQRAGKILGGGPGAPKRLPSRFGSAAQRGREWAELALQPWAVKRPALCLRPRLQAPMIGSKPRKGRASAGGGGVGLRRPC